jgi:hypothetical protein
MNPNCIERRDSVVALQALQLTNSGMVHELAEQFARRVSDEVGADPVKQVERVYLIALSRLPGDWEKQVGIEALQKLSASWAVTPCGSEDPGHAAGQKALITYCHAIMNSAGFLYVD